MRSPRRADWLLLLLRAAPAWPQGAAHIEMSAAEVSVDIPPQPIGDALNTEAALRKLFPAEYDIGRQCFLSLTNRS